MLGATAVEEDTLRQAFSRQQSGEDSSNRVETRNVRKNSVVIHCEWFNSALTDDHGCVASIMSLVQDVSGRVQIVQQMRELAEHDSLTGLLNRSAFRLQMERGLRRARNTQELVALLFIDLDGFKQVNDTLGHGVGDEVLREVARRITQSVPLSEPYALDGLTNAAAMPQMGASVGVALYTPQESHVDSLFNRADAAMYDAKRAGKGCVRYAVLAE